MSNIGSRTSSITATAAPVLGYDYASNIVLEESMMQVSFGLTTQPKSRSASKNFKAFLVRKLKIVFDEFTEDQQTF